MFAWIGLTKGPRIESRFTVDLGDYYSREFSASF